MGISQQNSLLFDIKLSESLAFTPPTRLDIYELNSEERHFQVQIPLDEAPEITSDLVEYIQREFKIASPIYLLESNGLSSECYETHFYFNFLSWSSTFRLFRSAISTQLNASTNTTLASVVPNNPIINDASVKVAGLSDSDFDVDETINTTHEDYEKISRTSTMKNSVSSATTMSFADWEFLNVQRRLKSFMSEANIEERRKLKKWFLEFYETFELKRSTSANVRAESPVPCSSVDTNEIEISMGSETVLNDPTSQLTRTLAEATPAAFPPIADEPIDNSVSEPLMDDTGSGSSSDVEGLSLLYILDSTSSAEENEVGGSDREETISNEDNNTLTFVIDISETTADTPESSVQGSNCEIVRTPERVKSRNTRCQNVALEITKRSRRPEKAIPNWQSCSYPSCNFKPRSLFEFKKHLGKVHSETPFKCGKCGCKYRLPGSLCNHLKTHEEKKQTCFFKNCNYKSFYRSHLKAHMKMHRGVKPFACKECNYKVSNKSRLQDHMRTHTGEKPFACKQCEFKTAQSSNLKKHMMSHTGEKPFVCKQCVYRCCTKLHLKSHVYRRHGVKK